jgi:hypothetical protein
MENNGYEFSEGPEVVGLMFFRKGETEPDGKISSLKDAQGAIKHFVDWMAEDRVVSKIWISEKGDFSINLEDVSLVRYDPIQESKDDDSEDEIDTEEPEDW